MNVECNVKSPSIQGVYDSESLKFIKWTSGVEYSSSQFTFHSRNSDTSGSRAVTCHHKGFHYVLSVPFGCRPLLRLEFY